MNWDAVAAISGIISSLAVVGSLLYLSTQVKLSNKFSQSQTRVEIRHMAQQEMYRIIEFPEIWLSMYKDNLTEQEKTRLHAFLVSSIRFREFTWRQHQLGLLDRRTFENYSKPLLQILASERTKAWWAINQNTGFDPEFVNFVRQLLAGNELFPPGKSLQGW